MASSVSSSVVVPQATKRAHAEMSNTELSGQHNQTKQSSTQAEVASSCSSLPGSKTESKFFSESRATGNAVSKFPASDSVLVNSNTSLDLHPKENATAMSLTTPNSDDTEPDKQSQKLCNDATKTTSEAARSAKNFTDGGSHPVETKTSFNGVPSDKSSAFSSVDIKEVNKTGDKASEIPTSHVLASPTYLPAQSSAKHASEPGKSAPEIVDTTMSTENQDTTNKASSETAASQSKSSAKKTTSTKSSSKKGTLEYGEEPEKKAKIVPSSSKGAARTAEQILEYMDKTFEQRRKIITKQMPSIPELKDLYPDLFTGKQLLLEFQRITKIDIDQKIQEFCVRYATAVIEMAENKKEAAHVLARWEQAKLENDTLKQYWDMVTALCLLPLHFGENFVEMVLEIGEDEEVVAQGKIVPTLVARGNIFRTDEFFLIAENTIVQEFEEFTIAFASLYSSYWVFNMVYPETIESTYNYIQRCIVRQREPGSIPLECKNFTKALLKWNKGKDGK